MAFSTENQFEEKTMLNELITNMQASTPQGFLGVGLIVFYFFLIVGTAVFRIIKADHMDHH